MKRAGWRHREEKGKGKKKRKEKERGDDGGNDYEDCREKEERESKV